MGGKKKKRNEKRNWNKIKQIKKCQSEIIQKKNIPSREWREKERGDDKLFSQMHTHKKKKKRTNFFCLWNIFLNNLWKCNKTQSNEFPRVWSHLNIPFLFFKKNKKKKTTTIFFLFLPNGICFPFSVREENTFVLFFFLQRVGVSFFFFYGELSPFLITSVLISQNWERKKKNSHIKYWRFFFFPPLFGFQSCCSFYLAGVFLFF